MIEIISPDTRFDFVSGSSFFGPLSVALVALSVLLFFVKGPNYGIDFKGGTDMILQFEKEVDSADVRDAAKKMDFEVDRVQTYGGKDTTQFLVQTQDVSVVNEQKVNNSIVPALENVGPVKEWEWTPEQPNRMNVIFEQEVDQQTLKDRLNEAGMQSVEIQKAGPENIAKYTLQFQDLRQRILQGFSQHFGDAFDAQKGIQRLETVGARVGEQLRRKGMVALMLALVFIFIYIFFRFDLRYAPGAVAALIHDVTIAIGFFIVTELEISLPIIAAMLTIIGYSLNDTIVVFDRVRENRDLQPTAEFPDLVNESINETLSRTIMTSMTTFVAVACIAIWGGGLIRNFAIALMVGVVVGTYSSVFVASPVLLKVNEWMDTPDSEAEEILQSG